MGIGWERLFLGCHLRLGGCLPCRDVGIERVLLAGYPLAWRQGVVDFLGLVLYLYRLHLLGRLELLLLEILVRLEAVNINLCLFAH